MNETAPEQAARLFDTLGSYRKVAAEMGISHTTAAKLARQGKLEADSQAFAEQSKAAAADLIADAYGVPAAMNAKLDAALAAELAPEATQAERLAAARLEFNLLRAWEASDQSTPRPATPNYDLLDPSRRPAKKPRASTAATPRTPKVTGHRFTINGVPVSPGYRLGSIAWHRLPHGGYAHLAVRVRQTAAELRAELAAAGVPDPNAVGWEVELVPGVKFGAISEG